MKRPMIQRNLIVYSLLRTSTFTFVVVAILILHSLTVGKIFALNTITQKKRPSKDAVKTATEKKTKKTISSQNVDKTKLRNLQKEIERDRAKLRAMKQQERKASKNITAFREKDKKLQSSLKQIASNLQEKQDSLRKIKQKLTVSESSVGAIRHRYATLVRLVATEGEPTEAEYRSGNGVIEQELFTQAIVRGVALSTDARLGIVSRERDSLAYVQSNVRADVNKTSSLKNRTENEKVKLQTTLQDKQKELRALQADKKQLIQQIEEKKSSARKLAAIIDRMVQKADKNSPNKPMSKSRDDGEGTSQAAFEARAASIRGGFRRHSLPFPTDSRRILHTFGKHTNSATGTVMENPGIDIQTPQSSTVRAVAKGTVTLVNWLPGYGSLVIIDHGNTFRTVYANLASVSIQQGSNVKAATILGKSGKAADGEYIHFEIWQDRNKLNPASWLE